MTLPFRLVDAFAEGPLRGNPAGVVLLDSPLPDSALLELAQEVNHPETAFLIRQEGSWGLRWLTPAVEVDLCGHATLAAAAALRDWGLLAEGETAVFETRSGALKVAFDDSGRGLMDFPADPPSPADLPAPLAPGALWTGRSSLDWMAVVASPEQVEGYEPDMGLIASAGLRGFLLTSSSEGADQVVSRFFAPQSGVPEDGATGSAHCCLGPYWAPKLGLCSLSCRQASPKGARLIVEPLGERVRISGLAKVRIRGEIQVS